MSTPVEDVHAAEPGEPALVAVPGYAYANDPGMERQIRQGFDEWDAFSSYSVHSVSKDPEPIGTLILLKAKPAADDEVNSGLVDPLKSWPAKGVIRNLAGERVLTVVPSDGPTNWVWYHDGTLSQFILANGTINLDAVSFLSAYWREANR